MTDSEMVANRQVADPVVEGTPNAIDWDLGMSTGEIAEDAEAPVGDVDAAGSVWTEELEQWFQEQAARRQKLLVKAAKQKEEEEQNCMVKPEASSSSSQSSQASSSCGQSLVSSSSCSQSLMSSSSSSLSSLSSSSSRPDPTPRSTSRQSLKASSSCEAKTPSANYGKVAQLVDGWFNDVWYGQTGDNLFLRKSAETQGDSSDSGYIPEEDGSQPPGTRRTNKSCF